MSKRWSSAKADPFATFVDDTGQMELVWFQRTQMGSRIIKINEISVIFGNALRLMVPTICRILKSNCSANMNRVYARHATVYPSTETLTNRGFQSHDQQNDAAAVSGNTNFVYRNPTRLSDAMLIQKKRLCSIFIFPKC
jgi:ATP-dependent DNA helicase RecG